ncbi:MAG: TonB-dependent receptor [Vicinamibacterales bacterium]|jgi:iron complex outermembrane receptor protein
MFRTRLAVVAALLAPTFSFAQSAQPPSITLPPVIVTAQKEAADVKAVPASVTVVTGETIANAGLRVITDAAMFAPNTVFTEFTARKVSNARFRGIGSSPGNPAVTTYLDGVPQLNSNSSNIELLDVDQIEFVRGPQSSLFGRNALGGIVNVTSARPSTARWTGSVVAPFGDFGAKEVRGNVSGPLGDTAAISLAAGRQQREGYTVNRVTGNDLDFRDGTFAKAQLMLTPNANWQARVIYSHERNRDGDYALGDLNAIRETPFLVSRNFEGFTNRDLNATTVNLRRSGDRISIESTTGVVKWNTEDETDLDYTPLALATRRNAEEDFQFTQELRLASPENAPLQISDTLTLKWQGGVEYFKQNYDQLAVNTLGAFVLSPQIPFPVAQTSPESAIDSSGVGVFGHGTLTFNDRTDLTVGLRFDHEQSDASLNTFFTPAIAPPNQVTADASFSDVSPQFAVAFRPIAGTSLYASASRGFKAGGFNPAALPGSEAYGEEHAWHVEGGVKSTFAGGKMSASAAVFHIKWDDLQLNVPNPFVPGQFYIANVGGARSRGLEMELAARPVRGVDLFASFGFTSARFADGTVAGGVSVAQNKLPYTPDYTGAIGVQLSRAITPAVTIYGRGEAVASGAFEYDEANTARQDAYGLANFRAGARGKWLFAEAWVRNAFDQMYVPIAIPYPGFAPSGFVGENGRPRTVGVSAGFTF